MVSSELRLQHWWGKLLELHHNIISFVLAQGFVPFFVSATAGTTVYGAFDPLIAISDICKKYNIWMHVDVSKTQPNDRGLHRRFCFSGGIQHYVGLQLWRVSQIAASHFLSNIEDEKNWSRGCKSSPPLTLASWALLLKEHSANESDLVLTGGHLY